MKRALLIVTMSMFLVLPRVARAQDTPTETPTATPTETPTETPTQTPTSTPTVGSLVNLMAYHATCASTPCALPNVLPAVTSQHEVGKGGGHKTVAVNAVDGSGTVAVVCRPAAASGPDVTLGTLTGASCGTKANCVLEFDTWCDELWLSITACTNCVYDGWLRQDFRQP